MKLATWCKREGRGAKTRLSEKTGVGFNVILYLVKRRRPASYRVAMLISKATRGKVTVAELCAPVETPAKPRKRKAVKRKRAVKLAA